MIDGIVLSNILADLKKLENGRIDKIYQPNKEEIVLTVRAGGKNHKLLLSANASTPRINFTEKKLENPQQPPMFCMLLRKHVAGRIVSIKQPNFERIIEIEIESNNEMMELSKKRLIIEIMGKHSNIILVRDDEVIIDSIKHVNSVLSSVREVMPGKLYVSPPSQDKIPFLELSKNNWSQILEKNIGEEIYKIIYKKYTGISPNIANIICTKSEVNPEKININQSEAEKIYEALEELVNDIKNENFNPFVVTTEKKFVTSHSLYKWAYKGYVIIDFSSISEAIEYFYTNREQDYRITQKTSDLKKIISQNISRCIKKQDMFNKNLREISNKEQLKLYGELITANAHNIGEASHSFTTENFYDENLSKITIKLDPEKTPIENAQAFFKEYNKQKRAEIAIQQQVKDNIEEQKYLESVHSSLSRDLTDTEINEIREELADVKIIKNRGKNKNKKTVSQPLKLISSDGFEIFIGKNNKQNDEITTNANNNDMWLHTKDIPGSHVIIKTKGTDIPNTTIEEAAKLAAFYSKYSGATTVPVDYTLKKYVKKPNGAKPGMVIYTHQKTAFVEPKNEI